MSQKPYTRRDFERDQRIVSYIEDNGIRVDNPLADIDDKVHVLTSIRGFKRLRISADGNAHNFMPIESCKEGRISGAVRDLYDSAKRRLDQVKRGLRQIVEPAPAKQRETKDEPIYEQLSLGLQPTWTPADVEDEVTSIRGPLDGRRRSRSRRGPRPYSLPPKSTEHR